VEKQSAHALNKFCQKDWMQKYSDSFCGVLASIRSSWAVMKMCVVNHQNYNQTWGTRRGKRENMREARSRYKSRQHMHLDVVEGIRWMAYWCTMHKHRWLCDAVCGVLATHLFYFPHGIHAIHHLRKHISEPQLPLPLATLRGARHDDKRIRKHAC
jgi:hypothetical protein